MKKVLMLIDGNNFSEGAFNFAVVLNENQRILLTGLFLPSIDYTDISMYYIGGMPGPVYIPSADTDPDVMQANIEKFNSRCVQAGIEFRVHDGITSSLSEGIKKESRYTDLMILSGELFYSHLGQRTQKEYLENTMHDAECPLVIVPETFNQPQSIIMAFDGSAASAFAIKQFTYLFPELCNLETLIVHASDEHESIPDLPYMEELALRHFSNLTFFKLDADARTYFNTWITDKGNALLVTGSYGRSYISEIFRKSFIDEIISEHQIPVFIAHK